MSSIFRIFLCQLQKRDKTLWSRTFLFYHVRTMNLCAYEKGNKRAVKSWHEVAYEKSQTETILWPTIFAGKKLSLPCLKTDAFLAVKDCSFQARKTEENLLHCCWLLKMLSGIQKCSDSFFLFLIYTVRPCDMVFALWNGPANIFARKWSVQKVLGIEVEGLYITYQKYKRTRGQGELRFSWFK